MPFNIVQTIEDGKLCLTVVPSNWEKDGILYWPPKNKIHKLRDSSSFPEDHWVKHGCIVKRKYLENYEDASRELDLMRFQSDTDEEPAAKKAKVSRRSNKEHIYELPVPDLNYLFVNTTGGSNSGVTVAPKVVEDVAPAVTAVNLPEFTITNPPLQTTAEAGTELLVGQNILLSDCNFDNSFALRADSDKYEKNLAGQHTIMSMLERHAETQTKIMTQLAKHEAYLNEIYNKVQSIKTDQDKICGQQDQTSTVERFDPITTIEDLKALEENLKEKKYEQAYVQSLSAICSPGLRGQSAAYKLIDHYIARDLLMECSWTGSSRIKNSDAEKVAFKFFGRVRTLFFQIVHQVDPHFTMQGCDSFFKRILKNSKQRLFTSMKPMLTSTPTTKNKKVVEHSAPSTISDEITSSENNNPADTSQNQGH